MTALLKDPLARLFPRPVRRAVEDTVTITVEAMGPRWWLLHRSDGRSGGVFDDRRAALNEAGLALRALGEATLVVIDAAGKVERQRYIRGNPAAAEKSAVLRIV